MKKNKNNYCIVGFGNHAKNKLLPALVKLGKPIFGIVSSKKKLDIPFKIYEKLSDALNKSDDKTIFIVSSPPNEHYSQIKLLLEAKKNALIEKPIFVSPQEVDFINTELKDKNIIIAEMLMYKFTLQYKRFIKFWRKRKNQCYKIECFFNIPEIPSKTFRNNYDITSSSLYDVGCYLFSLLVDLRIYPINFEIVKVNKRKNKFLKFFIEGQNNNIDIYLEFGFGNSYNNSVKIHYLKNYIASFEKFFYGRNEEKVITLQNSRNFKKIVYKDINGFEEMFKKNISYWQKNQKKRFNKLKQVNDILFKLSEKSFSL